MPRSLTASFISTIQDLESGSALFYLITINSPEFAQPIRVVNNQVDVVSNGNTFTAMAFDISLAIDDGQTLPAMTATLDNVDRSLIREIRNLQTAPEFQLDFVLSTDLDNIELSFPEMTVGGISYDIQTIRLSITVSDILNRKWPAEEIMPRNYPGLFSL